MSSTVTDTIEIVLNPYTKNLRRFCIKHLGVLLHAGFFWLQKIPGIPSELYRIPVGVGPP